MSLGLQEGSSEKSDQGQRSDPRVLSLEELEKGILLSLLFSSYVYDDPGSRVFDQTRNNPFMCRLLGKLLLLNPKFEEVKFKVMKAYHQ